MRKFLLLISLLAGLSAMQAQETYQSVFGEHETSFNIIEEMIDGIPGVYSFYYVQDTVLESTLYKQFLRDFVPYHNQKKASQEEVSFLLRESEDRSKVYLRIINGIWPYYVYDSKEYLVMDLNLNERDTFILHLDAEKPDSAILVVENVYYDDKARKHIVFNENLGMGYGKFEFIEGVGSNQGLFYISEEIYNYGIYSGHVMLYLLCAYQDGINTYMHSSFMPYAKECTIELLGITEAERDDALTIYPNPARTSFVVNFEDAPLQMCHIDIFNLQGQCVKSIPLAQSKQEIDVGGFANGVYLVRLLTEQGESLYKKLIIAK